MACTLRPSVPVLFTPYLSAPFSAHLCPFTLSHVPLLSTLFPLHSPLPLPTAVPSDRVMACTEPGGIIAGQPVQNLPEADGQPALLQEPGLRGERGGGDGPGGRKGGRGGEVSRAMRGTNWVGTGRLTAGFRARGGWEKEGCRSQR